MVEGFLLVSSVILVVPMVFLGEAWWQGTVIITIGVWCNHHWLLINDNRGRRNHYWRRQRHRRGHDITGKGKREPNGHIYTIPAWAGDAATNTADIKPTHISMKQRLIDLLADFTAPLL